MASITLRPVYSMASILHGQYYSEASITLRPVLLYGLYYSEACITLWPVLLYGLYYSEASITLRPVLLNRLEVILTLALVRRVTGQC